MTLPLERISRLCLIFAVVLGLFSFVQKNRLPHAWQILPELLREPVQSAVKKPSFDVSVGDFNYTVNPLFSYELSGLVVSTHRASSFDDYYHEKWKDYLNLMDIGVVWGDNLKSDVYQKIRFSSGSWTLTWYAPRGEDFSRFNPNQAANNHLISSDPLIRRKILSLRRGDQIRMKGYLATYGHKGQTYVRQTSTVRTDSGCEVIYVEELDIKRRTGSVWHFLFMLSWVMLGLGVLFWFRAALEPPPFIKGCES